MQIIMPTPFPQVGFKSRFWLYYQFSFFDFWQHLKKKVQSVQFTFPTEWRFRFRSYNIRNNLKIHTIAIFMFFPRYILLSLMFEIPLKR